MREISFVKRLKFNFRGSVTKKALVIGDADNDQRNELVCASLHGNLAIFKDSQPDQYAYATGLGMVTACVVGDIINSGKNYVAAINTEGWLFIFNVKNCESNNSSDDSKSQELSLDPRVPEKIEEEKEEQEDEGEQDEPQHGFKLAALYDQRMPSNCKELLLADLDGDGQNEVIVGLTDRVLRTYKWIKIGQDRGKFVGIYKWEFADQIGAVSLNPSRHENCLDIIVAQPGGTYARLECFDKKPQTTLSSNSGSLSSGEQKNSNDENSQSDANNVRTEYISKLTPEYHHLALAQMRNHHISTEVLGGIRDGKNSDAYSLIVIATLDGTLMLVNKDEILWSLQVDHQLFVLAILESKDNEGPTLSQSESTCTIIPNPDISSIDRSRIGSPDKSINERRNMRQHLVVCAWDGKTYIIDEERNYLRFKFDEAVSAFTAGIYHFNGEDHESLVYATFNNQIILYYDVILDHIRPMYLLEELMSNPEHAELLKKLELIADNVVLARKKSNDVDNVIDRNLVMYGLVRDILYGLTDNELNI